MMVSNQHDSLQPTGSIEICGHVHTGMKAIGRENCAETKWDGGLRKHRNALNWR